MLARNALDAIGSTPLVRLEAFEPQRGAAATAQIGRGIELKPVGREALHASRKPLAILACAVVEAHAELTVPEGGDGVAPEQFGARIL